MCGVLADTSQHREAFPGRGVPQWRAIYSLEVLQEGSEIIIRIKGNGFLYNMVRIITGTLIQVGKGRFKPEYVKQMLEAKDRTVAGQTAPPQGLTLVGIEYVDNDDARVV